jgi:hypothetical protein|tara:strand:+ start:1530 stop:1964 length:435 start_codon:yes stop_codon:yes gene_type:complete
MINTNKATNKGYDFSIDKPSNFNKDLKYGEKREKRVHDLLHMKAGDKFEVKTERDWWHRTDNTAIEVECNGSGSGITTTKSKYWVQVYADGDEDCAYLIIPTKRLRKIKDKYVHKKKSVGDGKRAKTILIPNSEILLAKNLIQK